MQGCIGFPARLRDGSGWFADDRYPHPYCSRNPMPEMTASELAKMLEGWPVGARGDAQHLCVLRDLLGAKLLHAAIDLACMAGLRWLGKDARFGIILHWCAFKDGTVEVWFREGQSFQGPTLLHAIDAAIRASK